MKARKKTRLWELQNREQKEGICPRCNRHAELNVEHIIPVHLLEQLGFFTEPQEDEENMELLCWTCNRFKAGKIDMAHPKTIPLLKKYINSLT